eukprot:scaffold132055_cov20-Cyclotella_meneghiniana.AAC.1
MEWPEWVKQEVLKTNAGQKGTLTNSDLEMAGLLLLWLVMEEVCDLTSGSHVALFSDNAPTVSWVNKLASKNSQVADQLIRALARRLKLKGASPLSTMHIAGDKNEMTDIPSRSFGSEQKWFCREDKTEKFVDRLPPVAKNHVTNLLRLADRGFRHGRVEATSKTRKAYWDKWRRHCQLIRLDNRLQGVSFEEKCNAALSFAAAIRYGWYTRGGTVRAGTVSQALSAVNTTIALDINEQPFKVQGSKDFLPLISQTLAGWAREDPPTEKKMPVEADIP